MFLSRLKIRNFRNLAAVDLELSPGVNLFFGTNAQGKTALLEAVGYLGTSTSHRTRRDEEMIRWKESAAYVCGVLAGEQEKTLEFGLSRDSKQVKVEGVVLKRIRDLYGQLRVVLFVPEDLEIVGGSPSERRRFIDLTLAQIEPEHISRLQEYQRILRSRNQLLKRAEGRRFDPDEMEIWDNQLAQAAGPICDARQRAVRELAEDLERFHLRMTDGRERLKVAYRCSVELRDERTLEQSLAEHLVAARDRDLQQGSTSVGPHRDDLQFVVDGRDLRVFGSQGQRRTGVLALRLAELDWLQRKTGQHPVMLLDDVIYEMDESRRRHFFEAIEQGGQVLITATELEHLAPLVPGAKLFQVIGGEIQQVEH